MFKYVACITVAVIGFGIAISNPFLQHAAAQPVQPPVSSILKVKMFYLEPSEKKLELSLPEMEGAVNSWLGQNPHIKVHQLTQSSGVEYSHVRTHLCLWYTE